MDPTLGAWMSLCTPLTGCLVVRLPVTVAAGAQWVAPVMNLGCRLVIHRPYQSFPVNKEKTPSIPPLLCVQLGQQRPQEYPTPCLSSSVPSGTPPLQHP